MARYGKKASEKVEKAMHEKKHGTLKSGRSGKKVTSRKQAIAIGLSESREAGANGMTHAGLKTQSVSPWPAADPGIYAALPPVSRRLVN